MFKSRLRVGERGGNLNSVPQSELNRLTPRSVAWLQLSFSSKRTLTPNFEATRLIQERLKTLSQSHLEECRGRET
jgi:hypothetical protein